jgi:hypothetical protein
MKYIYKNKVHLFIEFKLKMIFYENDMKVSIVYGTLKLVLPTPIKFSLEVLSAG